MLSRVDKDREMSASVSTSKLRKSASGSMVRESSSEILNSVKTFQLEDFDVIKTIGTGDNIHFHFNVEIYWLGNLGNPERCPVNS